MPLISISTREEFKWKQQKHRKKQKNITTYVEWTNKIVRGTEKKNYENAIKPVRAVKWLIAIIFHFVDSLDSIL